MGRGAAAQLIRSSLQTCNTSTRGGWRDPDTNHSCYCWHVFVPGIGVKEIYGLTATCSGFCVIARSTLECEIHRGT